MNINDGVLASMRLAPGTHIGAGPGLPAARGLVSGAVLAVRLRREPQRRIAERDVFSVPFAII